MGQIFVAFSEYLIFTKTKAYPRPVHIEPLNLKAQRRHHKTESAVDCFKAEAASRRIYGRIQQIQDRNLIEIQVEK